MVVVYSKSGCPQCVFTKKFLEEKEIPFIEKRVDKEERYRREVQQLGFQTLPLVQWAEEECIAGWQPEKLEEMVQRWQH